jgi:hypothetical protein
VVGDLPPQVGHHAQQRVRNVLTLRARRGQRSACLHPALLGERELVAEPRQPVELRRDEGDIDPDDFERVPADPPDAATDGPELPRRLHALHAPILPPRRTGKNARARIGSGCGVG